MLHFYRVYHSMRYVHGDLLLRLQHWLSDDLMERLRNEFADIVVAESTSTGSVILFTNTSH